MSNAFLWQQSRRESCGLNSEFGLGHRWTSEHEDSEVLVPNSEHQQSHCCNQRFGRGRAESALDKAFDVVNIRVSCARQVGARIGGLQGDELPADAEFLRNYATTNKEPIFIMAFDWNQAHRGKWPRTLVSVRLGSRLRCAHRRSCMNMITVATDAGVREQAAPGLVEELTKALKGKARLIADLWPITPRDQNRELQEYQSARKTDSERWRKALERAGITPTLRSPFYDRFGIVPNPDDDSNER